MKPYPITIQEEAARCLLCYDPPCSKACPSASDPASFIRSLRLDDLGGGARQAAARNPLGGACAAACTAERYCQGACIRGKIDRPVDIRLLHTYVARAGQAAAEEPPAALLRFAVLGEGLAGLACAAFLAQAGHKVDVFAAKPLFGTALLKALAPETERDAILEESEQTLRRLGVRVAPPAEKPARGYDAVVAASRAGLAMLEQAGGAPHTVCTGELTAGPDDAAFSVKKGRSAAARALKLARETEEQA